MITRELLLDVMPHSAAVVDRFVEPLAAACARWGIDTPARVAAFLAQAAHESGELRHLQENLNYSASALVRVWPNRFTLDDAVRFESRPEAIANRVYANRMGNGDERSGDGSRYRGRGIFQLTGRANYAAASIGVCGDADTLLVNPELVADPAYACETAGWYWADRDLNALADVGDFRALTRAINGGFNGLEDRTAFWRRAIAAMA